MQGAKAVPPQMSKAAWLLFLRECLLYDNSFAHFDAEDIFETAFRSQEEEAGTVLAEFDEDAEPPSWESSVRGSHASRRTSPFRRSDGRRSRSSRDNGRAAESSGSGKSDSEKSESGRRLSDLVTERPESKNSSNSSKSGPRRFRPSREVWFRSSLGAENGQNGRAATPYSTDSVRPMTGQSSLGRPMLDSNASDRPDSAWSSVGRPDSGGSAMTRPETGESAFRQLDSAGSDLRRPMTAANNLRQATPAGSDRGQPKKDLRQRSSEGARAPARAFDDERMLGFEGFKDALWLVSTVLFRHRKELTAVPLAVPATVPLAVPVTVPLVLPPGVSSAGLLSIEDEVDLILDGLIADVVADSHVSSPNSQRGESVRRGNRWETAPVIGFHPVVDHGTRKLSGSVASRGMSRSVDPSGMAERTTTNFAPAKPVETIVGAVRTESDEDAFTRQILGRHVAALEQRVVMDRAFPGIIKPQHFQALQPDIVLLYQVSHEEKY